MCCVDADDKVAVSGSFDKAVRVWNPTTGECLRTFSIGVMVRSVKIVADLVIVGCWDGNVQVWSMSSGKRLASVKAHVGPVVWVCANERRVFSCSKEEGLKVLDFGFNIDDWTSRTFGHFIRDQTVDIWSRKSRTTRAYSF